MSQLGSLNPKYWYINEDGEISKYHYCKLCHAGPFKESEKKEKFLFFGMGNKDPYCMACSYAHKNFQTDTPPSKGQKNQIEERTLNLNPFTDKTEDKIDKIIEMSAL